MNSKAIKRQLLAAIAMVLVAALALGSSTYAWFAASGNVTAKGMQVTAQAESGILIKVFGAENSAYGTVATTTKSATLFPVSTANLSNWYHSSSTDIQSEQGGTNNTVGYTPITENLDSYRLVETFTIRSATDTAISNAKLQIAALDVTAGNQTPDLNKSVRVGVLVSGGAADDCAFYIYAPKTTTTSSDDKGNYFQLGAKYDGSTATQLKEYTAVGSTGKEDYLKLKNNTIPADDTTLTVDIFVWYEGEDPGCKTVSILNSENMNVLTPDTISVSVTFKQAAA